MNRTWNQEMLPEAVRRHNLLAAAVGRMLPGVCEALNGARITADKVDKRTREKVSAIIAEHMPKPDGESGKHPQYGHALWARVYLDTQYTCTLYLHADFNSPVSDQMVEYGEISRAVARQKDGVWMAIEPDAPALVTVEEIESNIAKVGAARKAEAAARNARIAAEIMAQPFVTT